MVGSKFATPLASLVTPKDMDIADRDSRTWFSHCFFIYPRSILPEFNIYRRSTSLLVRVRLLLEPQNAGNLHVVRLHVLLHVPSCCR